MSFFKKKGWLVLLIIISVTILLAYFSQFGNNPISNSINSVVTPVRSAISRWCIQPVKNSFEFCINMKQYKTENEQLKIENQKLNQRLRDVSEYMQENDRLKELLGIRHQYNNYSTVGACVVGYDADNWFSYITIDKGTSSGVEKSDTVITAHGLLGQVTEVGSNWAKVSTLINAENSAGVRIVRNGEIGIAEGDITLSKTNKCKLGYLVPNASVIAGDILETSGLGGIYPPGLMVGKISDVKRDRMGQLQYAVIEPFVDFDNLYEVIVITDWSIETEDYSGSEFIEPDNQNTEVIDDNLAQPDDNGVSFG